MIYISHRGNIYGKQPDKENSIVYIEEALKKYYVEIDVWKKGECLFLGHDNPKYLVDSEFIYTNRKKLLCHAKNIQALTYLHGRNIHCFWHNEDEYTITSKGLIIALPSKWNEQTICMLPETYDLKYEEIKNCVGICSDKIGEYFD